jgi:hypothetical protein
MKEPQETLRLGVSFLRQRLQNPYRFSKAQAASEKPDSAAREEAAGMAAAITITRPVRKAAHDSP